MACEKELFPELCRFKPDLLFISAGFDAHRHDLIGQLNLHSDDYIWITEKLLGIANIYCKGRVVSVLEGGYNTY